MNRILLIGKDGMLGSELYERLINNKEDEVFETTIETLDICNKDAVFSKVKSINPNYIINCAAYTNVDGCEVNYDLAEKVNGYAVENIALAAKEVNATLIHISTDYVFDGKLDVSMAYDENMQVGPVSAYGKSKLIGEENAKKAEKYYILRTAWLYGHGGKNFVKTMLTLSETKNEISVVCDQNGSPTSTTTLCYIIEKMIEINPNYGIYHSTNEGFTNWADFAEKIFEFAGKNVKVNHITSEEYKKMYPNSSDRPKNSKLSKEKLHSIGVFPMSYEEALKDYLKGGI